MKLRDNIQIEARAIEDVTDRAGPSSQTNAAAGPMDIDMSDNEIPGQFSL